MVTALFLTSSLVVIATPGPDAALATQLVLRSGSWRPAAAAAIGMLCAGVLHAAAALSGVSLIVSTVPALFTALLWTGAAVLFLLGAKALRAALQPAAPPGTPVDAGAGSLVDTSAGSLVDTGAGPFTGSDAVSRTAVRSPAWRYVRLGLLCTGTNPKVGLFLVAYLPQFVPVDGSYGRSVALLAGVYLSLAAVWLAALITAVHLLHGWAARRRPVGTGGGVTRAVDAAAGVVFILLAVRLVWPG